jgi:hypothetical protein
MKKNLNFFGSAILQIYESIHGIVLCVLTAVFLAACLSSVCGCGSASECDGEFGSDVFGLYMTGGTIHVSDSMSEPETITFNEEIGPYPVGVGQNDSNVYILGCVGEINADGEGVFDTDGHGYSSFYGEYWYECVEAFAVFKQDEDGWWLAFYGSVHVEYIDNGYAWFSANTIYDLQGHKVPE